MIGREISVLTSTPTERLAMDMSYWSPTGLAWKELRRARDWGIPYYSINGDHQRWGRRMRERVWLQEAQARWLADGGEHAWLPPYRPRLQP